MLEQTGVKITVKGTGAEPAKKGVKPKFNRCK